MAFLDPLGDITKPLRILSIQNDDNRRVLHHTSLMLLDWIWDCTILPLVTDAVDHLLVGLAHNIVQVWATHLQDDKINSALLQTVQGIDRSISYCISIHPTGRIGVGTVTNEILVWDMPATKSVVRYNNANSSSNQCRRESTHIVSDTCRLAGHKGVIHALCFDETGLLLVSASDDRSVRAWMSNGNQWSERWTAWGHEARVWSVALTKDVALSTGEDGTARSWDVATGKPLAVFRGHGYQCIRSVDTYQDRWIVTGGNDGTVAIFDSRHYFNAESQCTDVRRCHSSTSVRVHTIPDDRDVLEDVQTTWQGIIHGDKPSKKRTKSKQLKQVIAGMDFWPCSLSEKEPGLIHDQLVVATRRGSVMMLDSSGLWKLMNPWKIKSDSVSPLQGCCMKLHPNRALMAVGTVTGDIVLAQINVSVHAIDRRIFVLPASQYRAVQSLKWFDDNTLVSFHVQKIAVWTLDILWIMQSSGATRAPFCVQVLATGTKGMATTGAFNTGKKLFVVGDTRGNLSLFEPKDEYTRNEVQPLSHALCAHKKEHVNDIYWSSDGRIISVGNDGRVVESLVDEGGILLSVLSYPVGNLTGITNVWHIRSNEESEYIAIGGYNGNVYSIVHVTNGYEFVRINTGGRQRNICIRDKAKNESSFPRSSLIAICENRTDGRNDITLACYGAGRAEQSIRITHAIGHPFHSDSIFDANIFSLDNNGKQLALLTASEDCTSAIALLEYGQFMAVKRLPAQISGVRAICSSRGIRGDHFVAVGGGRLETQFFRMKLTENPQFDHYMPRVQLLGSGRPLGASLLDQRINCIRSTQVPLGSTDATGYIVFTGDSSGACCVYNLSSDKLKQRPTGVVIFRSERPILCLSLVQHSETGILAFLGTTDGLITVLDVSSIVGGSTGDNSRDPCVLLPPLLSYRAHSMGTNAVSARCLHSGSGTVVRVCSVGDDQAICCSDISIELNIHDNMTTASLCCHMIVANASTSALKGVDWVHDNVFVTVGYAQRLALWHVDLTRRVMLLTAESPVGVGDVNCSSVCANDNGYSIVVCGGGVELFNLPYGSLTGTIATTKLC